jgi:hypothetical protein
MNSDDVLEMVKCGYGQLKWPDGTIFEGFWHNNVPISIGVFRTPEGAIY